MWLEREECLSIVFRPREGQLCGLPPVGKGDKPKALAFLCEEVGKGSKESQICRVGEDFVTAHVDQSCYTCLPDRNNSDYVYLTRDLIDLSGNKYHRKKNHLNQFTKRYDFEYKPLDANLVERVLGMQETWCQMRECVLNPELLAEDFAVREALGFFGELGYQGGAILIDSHRKGEPPDTGPLRSDQPDLLQGDMVRFHLYQPRAGHGCRGSQKGQGVLLSAPHGEQVYGDAERISTQ